MIVRAAPLRGLQRTAALGQGGIFMKEGKNMPTGQEQAKKLIDNMELAVFGKTSQICLVTAALLARGHVLLEDVPGVGKTTLALALAKSVDLSFGRIQFTPDTLPGDITGYATIDMRTGDLRYTQGPVMNNIVLADEINRTSPKTQASLLEVMEEGQVSAEGRTMQVPRPFMVIATENPIDFTGTYNLPEAQLDRFLMRISLGYPEAREEEEMLRSRLEGSGTAKLQPVLTGEELLQMQEEVSRIDVSEAIRSYVVRIAAATRGTRNLTLGASPRASLALASAARAWAYLEGRDYVIPEDVQAVAPAVLTHRLVLSLDASLRKVTVEEVLRECLQSVPVPPVFRK